VDVVLLKYLTEENGKLENLQQDGTIEIKWVNSSYKEHVQISCVKLKDIMNSGGIRSRRRSK
jgi:hypothetical protein